MSMLTSVQVSRIQDASGSVGTLALNNATTRKVAGVFLAEYDITISKIYVHYASKTGTTPTYRVSLQGLDGSANPNGTVLGGVSPASATFSPSSLAWSSTSVHAITLDNSYVMARGTIFAVVVDYSSGTIDASNFANFGYLLNNQPLSGIPFATDYQGAWTKRTAPPVFAYGDGTNIFGSPLAGVTSDTYSSASTYSEYGLCFTIPESCGSTFKLYGIEFLGTLATSFAIKLYNGNAVSDTTVIQSAAGINGAITASGNRPQRVIFSGTLATLSSGIPYRVSLLAESGSMILSEWQFTSAADRFAELQITDGYVTARKSGNWTDFTTLLPQMRLLIGDQSVASGAVDPLGSLAL